MNEVVSAVITYGTSAAIGAAVSLTGLFLTRKWNKEDKSKAKIEKQEEQTYSLIREMKKRLDELCEKHDEHVHADEIKNAKEARRRALQMADEIAEGRKPSKERLEDVLTDIDEYESFCRAHEEFENSKAVSSIKAVKEYYNTLRWGQNA